MTIRQYPTIKIFYVRQTFVKGGWVSCVTLPFDSQKYLEEYPRLPVTASSRMRILNCGPCIFFSDQKSLNGASFWPVLLIVSVFIALASKSLSFSRFRNPSQSWRMPGSALYNLVNYDRVKHQFLFAATNTCWKMYSSSGKPPTLKSQSISGCGNLIAISSMW